MAPMPPLANLHSQFIRVWVREPSSLSNRPDTLDPEDLVLDLKIVEFQWRENHVLSSGRGNAPGGG